MKRIGQPVISKTDSVATGNSICVDGVSYHVTRMRGGGLKAHLNGAFRSANPNDRGWNSVWAGTHRQLMARIRLAATGRQ